MRRVFFVRTMAVLAVAVFSGVGAFAQRGATPDKPDKDLEAAIAARQRAVDVGDAAAWSKWTAEDYVQVMENGRIRTRTERLNEITRRNAAAAQTVVDSLKMTSPDSAVLIQHDSRDEQRLMMFWVRQNGAWKCVSAASLAIK